MELEYRLPEFGLDKLRLYLAPRNQCLRYAAENGGIASLITKRDFNRYCNRSQFSDGPFSDSFGGGYGEPYNSNRQAFGKLKSGKVVYCETSPSNNERVKDLLKSLKKLRKI